MYYLTQVFWLQTPRDRLRHSHRLASCVRYRHCPLRCTFWFTRPISLGHLGASALVPLVFRVLSGFPVHCKATLLTSQPPVFWHPAFPRFCPQSFPILGSSLPHTARKGTNRVLIHADFFFKAWFSNSLIFLSYPITSSFLNSLFISPHSYSRPCQPTALWSRSFLVRLLIQSRTNWNQLGKLLSLIEANHTRLSWRFQKRMYVKGPALCQA